MITVYAKLTCGCCTAEMRFRDKDSAEAAFDRAGLGHTHVTDDDAVVHEGVDTFYGFTTSEDEKRGLDYLARLVSGQAKWPTED
jgi:hypothetical protein